jgi:hypothetical protein
VDVHAVSTGPDYTVVTDLSIGTGALYSCKTAFTRQLHVTG